MSNELRELQDRLALAERENNELQELVVYLLQFIPKELDWVWQRILDSALSVETAKQSKIARYYGGERFPSRTGLTIKQAVSHAMVQLEGRVVSCQTLRYFLEGQGVEMHSYDPIATIDGTLINLRKSGFPIERVAPREWRYYAEPPEPAAQEDA